MKSRKRLLGALALIPVAALALAGCSAPPDAGSGTETDQPGTGEIRTVSVAAVGIMSDVALDIAVEQGFFEEEGLAIEVTQVANPPAGVAALQGGQVDFAFAPGVVFANARSQGVPVQAVAGASGFPEGVDAPEIDLYDDTGIYVHPDSGITSLEQLEGKTIAVNARKANLEATASQALLDAGVNPNSINWIALDFTSMVQALTDDEVDAAVPVNPFTLRAEEAGMVRISSPAASFFGVGPSSFWLTSESLANDDPELVAAFKRAILKANVYANAHLEESIAAGVALAGLDIPVEQAGRIYWPEAEVTQADIDRIGDNLIAIEFLPEGTTLENAVVN